MKKMLSIVLVWMLTMVLAAGAVAEPFYLEEAGVTLDVPEGMTAADGSDEDGYALIMSVDGRDDLVYVYALAYLEDLAGKYLEDMSDDEAYAFGAGIATAVTDPEMEMVEFDGVTYVVVADAEGTQLHYMTLLNGWITDMAVAKSSGALMEDEIVLCAQLLLSIEYDEE